MNKIKKGKKELFVDLRILICKMAQILDLIWEESCDTKHEKLLNIDKHRKVNKLPLLILLLQFLLAPLYEISHQSSISNADIS
jgi:hypothetical protein